MGVCDLFDTDSVAFSFYIKGGGGEEIFLKKMLNQ